MRRRMAGVSAISTGFGIWATHFVAMLAFTPGIPSGYNVVLTILSLVAAILLTAWDWRFRLIANWRHGPWLGGAIVAGGIAAMHYTGMAAFEVAGHHCLGSRACGRLDHVGCGARRHRASGRPSWRGREVEDRRRPAVDAGDLQPSLHGDGRCVDHSRSDRSRFRNRRCPPDGSRRRGARELRHHRAGTGRRRARYSRPSPLGARGRPDARPRQCIGRGTSGLRRRNDRLRQYKFRGPDWSLRLPIWRAPSSKAAFPTRLRAPSCCPARAAGRNQFASSRRLDDAGRTDPAADRFRRTAASRRRGSRSAGAQGSRAAYPLSRASRRADVAAQSQPFQRADRPGDRGDWPRARASRCSASTSTGSRRSTTCSATPRATRCFRSIASRVTAVLGERQMMARLGRRRVRRSGARSYKSRGGQPACREHPGSAARNRATRRRSRSRPASASRSALTMRPIAKSLLTHADTALYRAKTEGRNTYRFFEAQDGRRGSRTPDAGT